MTEDEKEKKKGLDIADWIKLIGYVAAILVATTSLLSARGDIPSWWFDFSLIFLMMLIFSVPVMIFAKPISKKVSKLRVERKRNTIAQKYLLEFKNLVEASRTLSYSIRSILDSLRNHYSNDIKSSLVLHILQSYNDQEIQNFFYSIDKELNESNKTFRDLLLIMKRFELVLYIHKKYLKIIEEFVHEIMNLTQKPIAKGIEAEFESFREKYNDFVKDFQDYCKKVNQELGDRVFPEWASEYVKKW
jgi:hypothetical protein